MQEARIVPPEEAPWTLPSLCVPGEEVLVHVLWSPNPGSEQTFYLLGIPEHPQDEILGFWAPVPRVHLGVQDYIWTTCCFMVIGLVNLFQEEPDYVTILTLGREWRFPRDGQFQVAVLTQGLRDALEASTQEEEKKQ